jgi:hypothetical protein
MQDKFLRLERFMDQCDVGFKITRMQSGHGVFQPLAAMKFFEYSSYMYVGF